MSLSYSTIYGDYCVEVHLFPFRTEKLSSTAQMVLVLPGEYVIAILLLKPLGLFHGAFFIAFFDFIIGLEAGTEKLI